MSVGPEQENYNIQPDPNVPLRERTWGDHDAPWQYQPYHLTDLEKSALVIRRERMLTGEFTAEEDSVDRIDFQDPEYMQKAQKKDPSKDEHNPTAEKPETHDIPLGFYRNDFGSHDATAGDHDEEWQYQPYHLTDREKLSLLLRQEQMVSEEFPSDQVIFDVKTPHVAPGPVAKDHAA